ncbi:MAG: VOC family protein [Planctomycetota bacterium]
MADPVVHFDVCGPELGPLAEFYAKLFAWKVSSGEGYAQVDTGSLRGGLAESETTSVTLGIQVDDLDAALARASQLGGTVEMPATDNGWVTKAMVRDPAGNVVSLIQSDKPQS